MVYLGENMRRKLFAFIIAICLSVACVFCLTACGEDGDNHKHSFSDGKCSCGANVPSEGFEFALSEDGSYYSIVGIGSCEDNDIVIPYEYKGKPVKVIGVKAFENCQQITSVEFIDTVTVINAWAFSDCYNLKTIKFGKHLNEIDWCAFENCTSLETISIPDSVKEIDYGSFRNCINISKLSLGNGVKTIGAYAFSGCSKLITITLPSSLAYIGDAPFNLCSKLIEVYNKSKFNIIAGSESGSAIGLYAKNVYKNSNGSKLSYDENGNAFYDDNGNYILIGNPSLSTETTLTLPSSYKNKSYSISDNAFRSSLSLVEVVIPNGVTSIGKQAFSWCKSLQKVTIGDDVEIIGEAAFYQDTYLMSLTIGKGVKKIESHIVRNCVMLTSIRYNGTVAEWGEIDREYLWKIDSAVSRIICSDETISA